MRFASVFSTLLAGALLVQAAPVPTEQSLDLQSRNMKAARITFYSGGQLNNPACGGPRPSKDDMIAAVKQGGAFSCGEHVHLKHGEKSVHVRVVDYCESCSPTALDLSPAAFAKLASLSVGELTGVNVMKG